MKTLLVTGIVSLLCGAVSAQRSPEIRPHSPVSVFPSPELRREIEHLVPEAKVKGGSSKTLADYGSYKIELSVRTQSGGAEVHGHWDDVIMVEQGYARLITQGTVVDAHSKPGSETLGARVENGQSRALKPGDVFTVRAGTPHQTLLAPGAIYAAVVIKIHEP